MTHVTNVKEVVLKILKRVLTLKFRLAYDGMVLRFRGGGNAGRNGGSVICILRLKYEAQMNLRGGGMIFTLRCLSPIPGCFRYYSSVKTIFEDVKLKTLKRYTT